MLEVIVNMLSYYVGLYHSKKINLSETLLTSDKLFPENKNSWIGCISGILKFPQIKPHNVLTNQKRKQKYRTPETTG